MTIGYIYTLLCISPIISQHHLTMFVSILISSVSSITSAIISSCSSPFSPGLKFQAQQHNTQKLTFGLWAEKYSVPGLYYFQYVFVYWGELGDGGQRVNWGSDRLISRWEIHSHNILIPCSQTLGPALPWACHYLQRLLWSFDNLQIKVMFSSCSI